MPTGLDLVYGASLATMTESGNCKRACVFGKADVFTLRPFTENVAEL